MANATLIQSYCNKCGKVSKVTRKEGWKRAILHKGHCPDCAEIKSYFKPNKNLDKELKKEEKRGFVKEIITPGMTFSNIPAVNIGVKIILFIIFLIIMNKYFL